MSTASTRTEKRAPVTLKIKFKSSTLDQFVERYSVDISQGGIFIRTKSPLEVGTPLRFEFQLKDATPLITGEGTVVWTREYDPSRTGLAPGMGVRFDRLPAESQQMLAKILEQKKTRPSRPAQPRAVSSAPIDDDDPSDEFTDSPTRVAPRDVIAGLADTSRDNFPEHGNVSADAFEEATKVGLLDELVAKTAEPDAEDEPILTSAPRTRAPSSQPVGVAADTTDDDEDIDDDEPELPAPVGARAPSIHDEDDPVPPDSFDDDIVDLPAPAARKEDFLDHIPTELNLSPPPPSKSPSDHAPTEQSLAGPSEDDVAAAKEKLGGPAETLLDSVPPLPERPPGMPEPEPEPEPARTRAAAASTSPPSKPLSPHLRAGAEKAEPVESSGGGNGLWIAMAVGIILLAGGGGAWWMMNRDDGASAERPEPKTQPAKQPPPETQPPEPQPPEPTGLEATVASEVEGATAKLVDGDQSGPVPMTFKGLEEGKTYKVAVSAPGFLPAEVEIKGGEAVEPVKLEAKPRFLSVNSTPPGAAVYINKRRQKGTTPFEVELTGPLAKAETYNIELRRAGYNNATRSFAATDTWSEEDKRMVASLELTLDRRAPRKPPTTNTTNTNGGKTGGDSGKTGGDSGKTGGDSGDSGKSGGDSGKTGGEPVPDWAKDKGKKKPEGGDAKPPADPKPSPTPAPSE